MPNLTAEDMPVAWYRDQSFTFHFSLGSTEPKRSTSDPDEWKPLYSAALRAHQQPTALQALQAVADLPTPKNYDEMNGQETAYRAIEKLFPTPPDIWCNR